MVEYRGFEPLTFSLRTRRSTNLANTPLGITGGKLLDILVEIKHN